MVAAGSSRRLRPPWPVAGSQPSWSEKTKISSRPSQKLGIDTPPRATSIAARSIQVLCHTAASRPSARPTTLAITMAVAASSSVLGSCSAISWMTGRRVKIERPKSPATARVTKRTYCSGSGSSRRSWARSSRSCSGVALAPLRMASTGSPGSRWTIEKTTTDTPTITGTDSKMRRRMKVSSERYLVRPTS